MPPRMRVMRCCFVLFAVSVLAACHGKGAPLESRNLTHAELRAVRRGVHVTPPGERARSPYARERLADGADVSVDPGGLAWLRRDGGATLLILGPAKLTLRTDTLIVDEGKLFVDTLGGAAAEVDTPAGPLHLSGARVSLEVSGKADVDAYVLAGEVKTESGVTAGPGDSLHVEHGKADKHAVLTWEDWTGGLATTDQTAEPAPFGVGTVGARTPGAQGQARFALTIQKLEVRVTIDHDLAITEVDELFFNPASETVEGIYKFRAPKGATVHRFGVDRAGQVVWGRVKEKAAAAAQYQSNVYQGSTEDPALLEWDAPGVYQARLYPIAPGGTRRVVTRYAEWLTRQGERGQRRLYVYPMAAEGAATSLPSIEELKVELDLTAAGATSVRTGMRGVQEGNRLIVRGYDVTPRADLAVELFDDGQPATTAVAYRAKHRVEPELLAAEDRERAQKEAKAEADYVLVPLAPGRGAEPPGGLDLAIVVDTSAATEPSSLAVARAATAGLIAHLGPLDRAAVWSSDAVLRPVADGAGDMLPVSVARRDAILAGLSTVERGGATDLGAVLTDAASRLDASRRSVVIYIGDGKPTVGELAVTELRERLDRLPRPTRLFALGVGHGADLGILKGLARGGFAERVVDGYGAATTSLRLLEEAERPVWLGVKVDLGAGVDRVYPREMTALFADETALVVGRLTGDEPRRVEVTASQASDSRLLSTVWMSDDGDLRRRWAEGRLTELLEEGAGRAAVVEVGVRYGVVTPFTSYYVPTAAETGVEEGQAKQDNEPSTKEGGSGTRAKGEAMPMASAAATATALPSPATVPPSSAPAARRAALESAATFGMIGSLAGAPAGAAAPAADPNAPSAPWGHEASDAFGSGGLGLSGAGEGGAGQGIGLGDIGTIGHGAGEGFGNGHGRLGGANRGAGPVVRAGAIQVNGRLPVEVIQRIVRQNFGRFRLCYENGLRSRPALSGRVTTKFVIDRSGAVATAADQGSDLPDAQVVACVVRAFSNLSFPVPDGGVVTVVYPVLFTAPEASASASQAKAGSEKSVVATVTSSVRTAPGTISWTLRPCDPSADQPLEERVVLWRERLWSAAPNAHAVGLVYLDALGRCEAPTWPERSRLLNLMLDSLPQVASRVALWRDLFDHPVAANILYRGLLARVHTTAEIHELHDALGLRRIDPSFLALTLAKEKSPEARAAKLRDLVTQWPDDMELALRLLDAYEDATDTAGERALARQLRRRPDANAMVRTAVGEAYLRLAKAPLGSAKDEAEARRAFGEIVEFAPDDPVARRRLGDLLRSHGWYDESFRQYETLAKLTPGDPSVSLLLASAAAGMGRVEEAVGWTEKAGASGAPDGTAIGVLARDLASVFLAWAEDDAKHAGRTAEVTALRERASKFAPSDHANARALLTWTHPEIRPVLWSNALGLPAPAPRGDPLLGLSEVNFSAGRHDAYVELRFDDDEARHAARLDAEAVLTVLYDEGADEKRIIRVPISLKTPSAVRRFRLGRDGAHEELVR